MPKEASKAWMTDVTFAEQDTTPPIFADDLPILWSGRNIMRGKSNVCWIICVKVQVNKSG